MVSLSQRLEEYRVHLDEKSEDEEWLNRLVTKAENFINTIYLIVGFLCLVYILKLSLCVVQKFLQLKTIYVGNNVTEKPIRRKGFDQQIICNKWKTSQMLSVHCTLSLQS